jgi:hypothetical protein
MVDLGNYFNLSQALALATRIGAQYARDSSTCKAGIQIISSPPVNSACTTEIQNAITRSLNYSAGSLTFPASFPLRIECDDGTPIAPGSSCAAAGRPAPNRVLITISASQIYTPMISWGFPTNLAAVTEIRLQ